MSASLKSIKSKIDRTFMQVQVPPATATDKRYDDPNDPAFGRKSLQHSILLNALKEAFPSSSSSIVPDAANISDFVDSQVASNVRADRCVGCYVGNCLGDAVGAPLEFTPADSSLPPYTLKRTRNDFGCRIAFLDETQLAKEPKLTNTLCEAKQDTQQQQGEELIVDQLWFPEFYNKFKLKPGQWTDDFSMAQCLADSLLVCDGYSGVDCRTRFYHWWFFGYNNAFRYDPQQTRTSVGLGGNISKSIFALAACKDATDAAQVPAIYEASGEDAGNGSMMRLSPVAIRFWKATEKAEEMAILSSLTTHPGSDAFACCQFMTFFITRAIQREDDKTTGIVSFVDATIAAFLKTHDGNSSSGMQKLCQHLLPSQPPSDKEAVWNWKSATQLGVEATLYARGAKYNGYPVDAGYFGSYCMDALAMSLWALHHTSSLVECLLRVVNLMGDSDTTGAICGQMAGAFYGYSSLLLPASPSCAGPGKEIEKEPGKEKEKEKEARDAMFGRVMLRNLRSWDPFYEVEMKALLLFADGEKE